MKILVIEDDPTVGQFVKRGFEEQRWGVDLVANGDEGEARALAEEYDVIVLDMRLPGKSGAQVLHDLRARGFDRPVLILTAQDAVDSKVETLRAGADDYVTKPFSIRELLARMRAHLRRAAKQVVDVESFTFSDVELNFTKYAARKGGQALDLSAREFEILRYLIRHRGEIVTRDQLLDEVWGYESSPVTRTVDNHIARLRQKIEPDPSAPQHIITVHRLGYRFIE